MTALTLACSRSIRISEAKRRFGLTERAIRFYEERGLIEVDRDMHNQRCFDEAAQRRLHWISSLRAANLPLRDIQYILEVEDKNGLGSQVAADRLRHQRGELLSQLNALDAVAATFESKSATTHAAA